MSAILILKLNKRYFRTEVRFINQIINKLTLVSPSSQTSTKALAARVASVAAIQLLIQRRGRPPQSGCAWRAPVAIMNSGPRAGSRRRSRTMDLNSGKKADSRPWRNTDKIGSPSPKLPQYASLSPKIVPKRTDQERNLLRHSPPNPEIDKLSSKAGLPSRLSPRIASSRSQLYPKQDSALLRALQNIDSEGLVSPTEHTPETLKQMIHAGEEYQRELLRLKEKRKAAHPPAPKRQQETAHRERDTLLADNLRLKSEKAHLEKQLLVLNENFERLKRKQEIDAFASNTDIAQARKTIQELEDQVRRLSGSLHLATALEQQKGEFDRQIRQKGGQLDRVSSEARALSDRLGQAETAYRDLFENYTKLQVFCESLQKEVVITKNYHASTQAALSQVREENSRLQQQKTALIQANSSALSQKIIQISALNKKVQELSSVLQRREHSVCELEGSVNQSNHHLHQLQAENQGLRDHIRQAEDKIQQLSAQMKASSQQVAKLGQSCRTHEMAMSLAEEQVEKIYLDYQNKERRLAQQFELELTTLKGHYAAQVQELQEQIEDQDQQLRTARHKAEQLELERNTLSDINHNLKAEIEEYSLKLRTVIQKNSKEASHLDQTKHQELVRNIADLHQQLKKTQHSLQLQKNSSEELHQKLQDKEELIEQLHFKIMQLSRQPKVNHFKEQSYIAHPKARLLFEQSKSHLPFQLPNYHLLFEQLSRELDQERQLTAEMQEELRAKDEYITKHTKTDIETNKHTDRPLNEEETHQHIAGAKAEEQRDEFLQPWSGSVSATLQGEALEREKVVPLESELQSLRREKEALIKMVGNKTRESERLKVKLVQIEGMLIQSFESQCHQLSSQHEKSLKESVEEKELLLSHAQLMQKELSLAKQKSSQVILTVEEQNQRLRLQLQELQDRLNASSQTLASLETQVIELMQLVDRKEVEVLQSQTELLKAQSELAHVQAQRQQLARINENKSRLIQELQSEIFLQGEQLIEKFRDKAVKMQGRHQAVLEHFKKEQEDCLKKEQNGNQLLSSYRLRCQELQQKILTLSSNFDILKKTSQNQAIPHSKNPLLESGEADRSFEMGQPEGHTEFAQAGSESHSS